MVQNNPNNLLSLSPGWPDPVPKATVSKVDLPTPHQGQEHVLSKMCSELNRG